MRTLSIILASLVLGTAGCAGLPGESRAEVMATAWSTVIAPMANAAIEESESLEEHEKLALRSTVFKGQEMLDNPGTVGAALAIHEAWVILRPFAETEIQMRVVDGRMSEAEGFAYQAAIRLFEVQLTRLLGES